MATECTGEVKYVGTQYRLRASNPMPKKNGGFVLHTFRVEKTDVDTVAYTKFLPGSEQFRGQGGAEGYISANFNRLSDVSGDVFQGKIVYNGTYIDETPFLTGYDT
ncbi:MAG: hypothetical protein DRP42_01445 [Tenericutes bacterium]|nr:MAG: hypothetical protein DRP42_01445 [Mycoplasmatota bacterium]